VGGSYELASSLSGAGTFKTGDYNLELTGNLNFTGTTDIGDGGSLQVFKGSLGDLGPSTGALVIGGDSTVATTGTVTLTGTNDFTGSTTINHGFTLLADSLASPTVTNRGSLGSTGAVGNNFMVGAGGTGALNQPAGDNGNLLVRLAGPAFDSYTAGMADLFGTVGVSGYGRIGTSTYDIVNAGALTTGTLNQAGPDGLIAISASPVLLQATLSSTGFRPMTTMPSSPPSIRSPRQKFPARWTS
jgi:autotransporter-associated beta strand protein